jgi:hypothetical protein
MSTALPPIRSVVDELLATPVRTEEVRTQAPSAPGLYAWWAPPAILPELVGPAHSTVPDLRLLYVGLATKLRSRLASNHLRRSGPLFRSSRPRGATTTTAPGPVLELDLTEPRTRNPRRHDPLLPAANDDGEITDSALAAYVAKYATKGTGKSETTDRPIRDIAHLDRLDITPAPPAADRDGLGARRARGVRGADPAPVGACSVPRPLPHHVPRLPDHLRRDPRRPTHLPTRGGPRRP